MKSSSLALVLAAVALTACSSSSEPEAPGRVQVDVVRSAQQRNTSPQVTQTEQDTFATSQAAFAVDLFQSVAKRPDSVGKNVFLSPHSVSTALAMTYAGARGTTAEEMKKALHFDLADARLHEAFNSLDLALESRGKTATGKDGKPFRLKVTNSIWTQKGSAFEAPFLDSLAVNYGAGLNVVDFEGETEKTRATINGWVEEKTEQRIKEILPENSIDAATRFVLVNAVYFNAAWASKFEPSATTDGAFTKADGATVQTPMMQGKAFRPYASGDGYEAVEMPYDGNELSMLVIAPTAGTFATFESALTGAKVLDILAGLQSKEVRLHFPKLKVEASYGLTEPLKSLGMQQAFGPGADFSGMSVAESFNVKDVLHKTFLELDENGTEAAAATAVVGEVTSAPVDPPVEMRVDRPFFTAIVDRQTKTLVFVGRIVDPTAQ
ncbi:MAG TPA: serpin family protein [Labilithrix sp.]|nr:serpin family protein [Labilithrix sp.]